MNIGRLVGRSITKGKTMHVIGILVSPTGEKWYDAYGPMTKDRSRATVFTSTDVAHKAAANRYGRGGIAFWECEREHEHRAFKQYKGWTNSVETVTPNHI